MTGTLNGGGVPDAPRAAWVTVTDHPNGRVTVAVELPADPSEPEAVTALRAANAIDAWVMGSSVADLARGPGDRRGAPASGHRPPSPPLH